MRATAAAGGRGKAEVDTQAAAGGASVGRRRRAGGGDSRCSAGPQIQLGALRDCPAPAADQRSPGGGRRRAGKHALPPQRLPATQAVRGFTARAHRAAQPTHLRSRRAGPAGRPPGGRCTASSPWSRRNAVRVSAGPGRHARCWSQGIAGESGSWSPANWSLGGGGEAWEALAAGGRQPPPSAPPLATTRRSCSAHGMAAAQDAKIGRRQHQ